jgi:hypothetical protein
MNETAVPGVDPENHYGCKGGTSIYFYEWAAQVGLTDETCAIYEARGWTNGHNCTSDDWSSEMSWCKTCMPGMGCYVPDAYDTYYTTEWELVNGTDAMMQALQEGPITCAIDAFGEGFENFVGDGIYTGPTNTTLDELDHEISLYGYGTEDG